MAIELSTLTFTELDDIVPPSEVFEVIRNTGIANTLAGNDRITGSGIGNDGDGLDYGFKNVGVLNTDDGNDTITGIVAYGRFNSNTGYNIINSGTLNTGDGNDIIDGSYISYGSFAVYSGIVNSGTLNAGEGNDTITGFGSEFGLINEGGTLNTGEGNDIITAIGESIGISNWSGGTINTGNGDDSIISKGSFFNPGEVFLGDGNDSISAELRSLGIGSGLYNFNFIGTRDGNDIITSTGVLYNQGVIETGNGDDSIIVDGGFDDITGNTYSIYNNGGSINMGDGNDFIIANEGFKSAENSSGAWFLGEGEDYIKGYGSGDFYGGNGNDTLELTPGTYTVGIWGEAGESPIFTKGDQLMITSEFEKLKVGSTIYDLTSLTAGQIIVVA